jgi:uncharacterized protein
MDTFFGERKQLIINIIIGVGILLALFLLAATIGRLKENRFVGTGLPAANTITVTGAGKVERTPDTAKISFSVRNESKSVKTAQDTVSQKIEAITKELTDAGIDKKYIKTDGYNSYPQYNYPNNPCVGGICPNNAPVIRGYEVAHMITVSVKDLTKVETVLGILAKHGVTDMNGPNFGFEDDKAVVREARDAAIEDAKEEAKKLARALGVRLVRVVSFSEDAGGYPMPMVGQARDALASKVENAPSVPIGAQNVETRVTVVYEIR